MRNRIATLLAIALLGGVAHAQPRLALPDEIRFETIHGKVLLFGKGITVDLPEGRGRLERDLTDLELHELKLRVSVAREHYLTRGGVSSVFLTYGRRELGLNMNSPHVKKLVQFLVKLRDSLRKRYPSPDVVVLNVNEGGNTRALLAYPDGTTRLAYVVRKGVQCELPKPSNLSHTEREHLAAGIATWRENEGRPSPTATLPAYDDGTFMRLTIGSGGGSALYRYAGPNDPGSLPYGTLPLAETLERALQERFTYREARIDVVVQDGALHHDALVGEEQCSPAIAVSRHLRSLLPSLEGKRLVCEALVKTDGSYALVYGLVGRRADGKEATAVTSLDAESLDLSWSPAEAKERTASNAFERQAPEETEGPSWTPGRRGGALGALER